MIEPILASLSSVGPLFHITRSVSAGAGGESPAQVDAAQVRERAVADRVEISPEARLAAGDLEVSELHQRDREVRAHEAAHKAAAGQYAGPISFSYETGPDGKRYAVGGSVPIDLSPIEGNPAATIRKMEQVMRAALAPADPSPEDGEVAARAAGQLEEARREISADRIEGASSFAPGAGRLAPASGPYQTGGAPSVAVLLDTYA